MNDRLAEGLQKNPVFQIATKSEDCLSAVFAYVNKNINKEEENTERNKQKTREFLAFASWNTDFCNPGASGHSAIPTCATAVFSTSHPLSRAVDLEFNTGDDTLCSMVSGITLTNGRTIGVKKHYKYDSIDNMPFLTEETETNEINPPDKATSMEKAYKRIIHTSYKDIELNGLVNQYFSAPVR